MNNFNNKKSKNNTIDDLSYYRSQISSAAQTVRTNYLLFVSFNAYLLLLVGATSDLDIVTGSKFTLPILSIKLPIGGTYFIAPLFIFLIHLNLLIHISVLARKIEVLRFYTYRKSQGSNNAAVRSLEFISQFLITNSLLPTGIDRQTQCFVHLITIGTIIFLPITLLLAFQIRYLPSHDLLITNWQRCLVIVDVLVSITFIFQISRSLKGFPIKVYTIPSLPLLFLAVTLSLFIAVIPGEKMETKVATPLIVQLFGHDMKEQKTHYDDSQDVPTLESQVASYSKSIFRRNLDLSGQSLGDKDKIIDLSGRDLRYANFRNANLDYSLLYAADLSGANLSKASLRKARMVGSTLIAANLGGANLTQARLSDADLTGANLYQTNLSSAILMRSDLTVANIIETNLKAAIVAGAKFVGARIVNVNAQGLTAGDGDFSHALIKGSTILGGDFTHANLGATTFEETNLFGVDFNNIVFDTKPKEHWSKVRNKIKNIIPLKRMKDSEFTQSIIILNQVKKRMMDITSFKNIDPSTVLMNLTTQELANNSGIDLSALDIAFGLQEEDNIRKQVEEVFAFFACDSDELARGFIFHILQNQNMSGAVFVEQYLAQKKQGDCNSTISRTFLRQLE